MAVTNGRWEAQIVVPTGGWDVELVEAAPLSDSGTATVTAGTYTWATFLVELVARLDAAASNTYTVAIGDGENGTGYSTITAVAPNDFSLTWTDTALRDLLGFTATISGSGLYTSPNHVKGIWLPNTPPITPYGISDFTDSTDETVTMSPDAAYAHSLTYTRKMIHEDLKFEALDGEKVRIAQESTTGESLQQFIRDVCWQDVSYLTARRVRIFPDAASATCLDVWIGGLRKFQPPQTVERYTGLFDVTFPRIVEIPA